MVEETIKTIKETENEADEIIRKADATCTEILEKAAREAKEIKEQAVANAKKQAEADLLQAKEEGEVLKKQASEKTEQETAYFCDRSDSCGSYCNCGSRRFFLLVAARSHTTKTVRSKWSSAGRYADKNNCKSR